MDQYQQGNGQERISSRFFVALPEQRRIFQQLNRSACDIRKNLAELTHEFLLRAAFPNILPGIGLKQVLSRNANRPTLKRGRQVLHSQGRIVVLSLNGLKRFADAAEQRALKSGQPLKDN